MYNYIPLNDYEPGSPVPIDFGKFWNLKVVRTFQVMWKMLKNEATCMALYSKTCLKGTPVYPREGVPT